MEENWRWRLWTYDKEEVSITYHEEERERWMERSEHVNMWRTTQRNVQSAILAFNLQSLWNSFQLCLLSPHTTESDDDEDRNDYDETGSRWSECIDKVIECDELAKRRPSDVYKPPPTIATNCHFMSSSSGQVGAIFRSRWHILICWGTHEMQFSACGKHKNSIDFWLHVVNLKVSEAVNVSW